MGNADFLDELLKENLDPDIGDSKGRTPLHIAALHGHEECVRVLLRHGCSTNVRDLYGNTALWYAISSKKHSVFQILYSHASTSDPYIAGELLVTAAQRNDLSTMKELLRHGLNIDSKDHHGVTPIQVAVAEKHMDMVNLLIMNGANVTDSNLPFSPETLNEMLRNREIGHTITMPDSMTQEMLMRQEPEPELKWTKTNGPGNLRVSIYRGHPETRRENHCREPGKLIRLPNTMDDLKRIAGEKFGLDASKLTVTDIEGSEIDSIEVIRDNDKLFIAENSSSYHI